jgi:hypothetical protein
MNPLRFIRTGDDAGPSEVQSVMVDRILSEISQLYFVRARTLHSGDQAAFQAANAQIAALKERLAKL